MRLCCRYDALRRSFLAEHTGNFLILGSGALEQVARTLGRATPTKRLQCGTVSDQTTRTEVGRTAFEPVCGLTQCLAIACGDRCLDLGKISRCGLAKTG